MSSYILLVPKRTFTNRLSFLQSGGHKAITRAPPNISQWPQSVPQTRILKERCHLYVMKNFLRALRVSSPPRANTCWVFAFGFQKRARRSSPERSQSSSNSQEERTVRGSEDEDDRLEFESASESEAGTRPRVVRGARMDDAEFERRNEDRVKAAIERKSPNKGVRRCPTLVFIASHSC